MKSEKKVIKMFEATENNALEKAQAAAQAAHAEANRTSVNRLGLIQAPESWKDAMRTHVNGHAVSSALEVAGNDVRFPATGATVRAVPAKYDDENESKVIVGSARRAVSRPGDTFWKGASGRKPLRVGDAPDLNSDEDENPPVPLLAPPDIIMQCYDGDNPMVEICVTWEMSWSDVLDVLKVNFSRAVIFTYTNASHVKTTCDCEDAFDIFCSDAEKFGSQASVYILNAGFRASDFITDAPKLKPLWSRDNMDDPKEYEGLILSRKGAGAGNRGGVVNEALEEGGVGEGDGDIRKKKGWLSRMEDAPYPIPHMMMLGANGLLVSLGAVVAGFFLEWNTLSAVSAALPCHLFALSFFVSEVCKSLLARHVLVRTFVAVCACVRAPVAKLGCVQ